MLTFEDAQQVALDRISDWLDRQLAFSGYTKQIPGPKNGFSWECLDPVAHIDILPGATPNKMEIFFDHIQIGEFLLPIFLLEDYTHWTVYARRLEHNQDRQVLPILMVLVKRRAKGLFVPTDWFCNRKRVQAKGPVLMPFTKLDTPAGVLYAQKKDHWVTYPPRRFDTLTGLGTGNSILEGRTLDEITNQLYNEFVHGQHRTMDDLEFR